MKKTDVRIERLRLVKAKIAREEHQLSREQKRYMLLVEALEQLTAIAEALGPRHSVWWNR